MLWLYVCACVCVCIYIYVYVHMEDGIMMLVFLEAYSVVDSKKVGTWNLLFGQYVILPN